MKIEVGTLQEIGAQVGDVVEWVSWSDGSKSCRDLYKGVKWNILQSHPRGWCDGPCAYYEKDSIGDLGYGYETMTSETIFRIISRANQGPVREVTTVRKVIMPGVYGRVCVSTADNNQVALKLTHQIGEYAMLDLSEMDALLDTLTAIRDAMADSSGDVSTPQAR